MIKTMIAASAVLMITGCGSNSRTYVDSGEVIPDTPTNGNAFIVKSSGDSTSILTYEEIGDGSINVTCGDGDNYKCLVSMGELIDTGTEIAGSEGSSNECPNGNCEK